MQRCVFLDRDGVINESPGDGYVLTVEDFHLTAGIDRVLQTIHNQGWLAVVVTSQRCVGRGLMDLLQLETIHQTMQDYLKDRCGTCFDAIYAFSGLPGTESWEKPQPGLVEQAVIDHHIDARASIMIGDQDRDIAMGIAARVGTSIRLKIDDRPETVASDYRCESVTELEAFLPSLLETLPK